MPRRGISACFCRLTRRASEGNARGPSQARRMSVLSCRGDTNNMIQRKLVLSEAPTSRKLGDFAPQTTRLGPGCGGSLPRRGRNTSAQGNALGPGGIPPPSPEGAAQDHSTNDHNPLPPSRAQWREIQRRRKILWLRSVGTYAARPGEFRDRYVNEIPKLWHPHHGRRERVRGKAIRRAGEQEVRPRRVRSGGRDGRRGQARVFHRERRGKASADGFR
jgi:hypothetical protein